MLISQMVASGTPPMEAFKKVKALQEKHAASIKPQPELVTEYNLIQEKQSRLSAMERKSVVKAVELFVTQGKLIKDEQGNISFPEDSDSDESDS